MSGMFESWMHKLVSAVMQREIEANVIVVDWLSMAQQLYPDAVNHTRSVGFNIATMLNWLQVRTLHQVKVEKLLQMHHWVPVFFYFSNTPLNISFF